ncbi:MAG: 50S ribosomal protein L22 [Candidatus Doudnabacteria bacterium]|nr:50S ribosomal protein L22 [Candidatus Doudnabacteria bacterium]
MEVKAFAKNIKGSPRKARIVADVVRGQNALYAVEALRFMPKAAAHTVRKAIESAIANAVHNHNMQADALSVTKIMIDPGMTYKRMIPQSRGRGRMIIKRTSNITVWVGTKGAQVAEVAKEPVKTKAAKAETKTKTKTKKTAAKPKAAAKTKKTTKAKA